MLLDDLSQKLGISSQTLVGWIDRRLVEARQIERAVQFQERIGIDVLVRNLAPATARKVAIVATLLCILYAGIVFVGPNLAALEAMASKAAAKALMARAGVPLVPGYHGEDQTTQVLVAEAARTGFPLMIKAAAGGGGKGMRIVEGELEFETQMQRAISEAESANRHSDRWICPSRSKYTTSGPITMISVTLASSSSSRIGAKKWRTVWA